MSSHNGIDARVLSHSFPHIFDVIVLFSDKETRLALRHTCHLVRRYVDAVNCRQLRGRTTWYFETVGNLAGISLEYYDDEDDEGNRRDQNDKEDEEDENAEGHDEGTEDDDDGDYPITQHALYDWNDPSVSLPTLSTVSMIWVSENSPDAAMEIISQRTSPNVIVNLEHGYGPVYCPLDNCERVYLYVNPTNCSCDPAQAIDYRFRAPEVIFNLSSAEPDPPTFQGENCSQDRTSSELPRTYREPRLTSPTSCNLLRQVLHPGLRYLVLLHFQFEALHREAPAFLFPKEMTDVKLPDTFKMKIQLLDIGVDTSSEKALDIRSAFAEHLGVTQAQVVFDQPLLCL